MKLEPFLTPYANINSKWAWRDGVNKVLRVLKDPDAGKDRGQEEKGTTEAEMVGWPR